jgi:hypothetical protein
MEIDYQELVKKYEYLTDHSEGLWEALRDFDEVVKKGLVSPFLEVGTNNGGSAICFLEIMKLRECKNWFYTVDPYGSIPYHDGGGIHNVSVYSNKRYSDTMKLLHSYAADNEINYCHFKCTSEYFINSVYPKFIQYENSTGSLLTNFSFAYLDGSHDLEHIKFELDFFLSKLDSGGTLIVDDTQQIQEQISSHTNSRPDLNSFDRKIYTQRYRFIKL